MICQHQLLYEILQYFNNNMILYIFLSIKVGTINFTYSNGSYGKFHEFQDATIGETGNWRVSESPEMDGFPRESNRFLEI